jgi:hypothetical protein
VGKLTFIARSHPGGDKGGAIPIAIPIPTVLRSSTVLFPSVKCFLALTLNPSPHAGHCEGSSDVGRGRPCS